MSLIYFPDCDACRSKQGDCAKHKASNSRKLHVPGQNEPVKLSYAIASFPEEVQLCVSSIPGAGCGVCAKQHIPVGTWIGPYEGKLVKCDEIKTTTDTSYMWEVLSDMCCLKISYACVVRVFSPIDYSLSLQHNSERLCV